MKRLIFPTVIMSLLLFGCSDTFKGKSVAEPKVKVFHDRFNAGQYEEIYSGASDEFQKAAPKEKVLAVFSAMDRKLGKVKSYSIKSWKVETVNFVTRVAFVVETQFEQGTGTETFTFLVSGDNAKLLGYNINSMDMMTR